MMHVFWTIDTNCPIFLQTEFDHLMKDTYLLFCNAVLIPFSQCYPFIFSPHEINHVSEWDVLHVIFFVFLITTNIICIAKIKCCGWGETEFSPEEFIS